MATHSSTLAWRIPWAEEPGRLQSMGHKSWTRLPDYSTTSGGKKQRPQNKVCLVCCFITHRLVGKPDGKQVNRPMHDTGGSRDKILWRQRGDPGDSRGGYS